MPQQPTDPIASLLSAIATDNNPGVIAWMNTLTHTLRFGGDAEIEAIRTIAQAYLDSCPAVEPEADK